MYCSMTLFFVKFSFMSRICTKASITACLLKAAWSPVTMVLTPTICSITSIRCLRSMMRSSICSCDIIDGILTSVDLNPNNNILTNMFLHEDEKAPAYVVHTRPSRNLKREDIPILAVDQVRFFSENLLRKKSPGKAVMTKPNFNSMIKFKPDSKEDPSPAMVNKLAKKRDFVQAARAKFNLDVSNSTYEIPNNDTSTSTGVMSKTPTKGLDNDVDCGYKEEGSTQTYSSVEGQGNTCASMEDKKENEIEIRGSKLCLQMDLPGIQRCENPLRLGLPSFRFETVGLEELDTILDQAEASSTEA